MKLSAAVMFDTLQVKWKSEEFDWLNCHNFLCLACWVKISADSVLKYFFFFFFFSEDSKETVCMKCQILFSGKKKNIIILSSVELAQRVVKMKLNGYSFQRQNNSPAPYTHTYGMGSILVLMLIPLLSASALASESHFPVCMISFDPVVGFLPNLHGYI